MAAGHDPASLLAEFAELLSIPNVASDPEGQERVAAWIVAAFARRGVSAHLSRVGDSPPLVHGVIPGEAGAPVVGVYAHYDGQPVAPERWASPPFSAALLTGKLEEGGEEISLPAPGAPVDPDWRIYARGSSDDRAPVAALLGALDAGGPRRRTIVFAFEGEEEIGSVHLGEHFSALREELAADIWLICDGPVHQSGRAQVALGVRGFAEVEIEVFGPPHDLHSGHYGETAVNPIVALAELITSMRDRDGRILVAGLSGPEPTAAEAEAAAAVPDPGDLGFKPNPEGAYSGRLLHPLLNLRGIASADVGAASRNVIPASATASIDLRLVAGQDPAEMIDAVKAHVAARGYHLVDGSPTDAERREHRELARVDGVPGYPGVRTSPDHPAVEVAVAAARAASKGEPILLPSFGGSVPLFHFAEHFEAPLAILPIANHDNNQHSENENLRVGNLEYGVRVMTALLAGD